MESVIEEPGFASGLPDPWICLSVCPGPGSPPCNSSLQPRQGPPQPWQRSVGSEILHRDGSAKDTTLPFDGCLFCYEQPHIVFLLFHSSSFHSPLSLTPAPGAQPQTFQLSQSCDVTLLPAGTCPFQDPAQHLLPRGASTTPAPSPGGRDSAVSTPAPSPQPLSPGSRLLTSGPITATSSDPQSLQIPHHPPL